MLLPISGYKLKQAKDSKGTWKLFTDSTRLFETITSLLPVISHFQAYLYTQSMIYCLSTDFQGKKTCSLLTFGYLDSGKEVEQGINIVFE